MSRTKVFISYARKDDVWRKRLVSHLKVLEREGLVELFDDSMIRPGEDWLAKIHQQMLQARVAVLLLSAVTSEVAQNDEVPTLFQRHEADGMTIYPLLIKDCSWEEVSWLRRIQIRPPDARPIASSRGARIDQLLANVAREIATIARTISRSDLK